MPEKERPIQPEVKEAANAIARLIDENLNPDGEKRFGFALLIFKFGEAGPGDRMNYIANSSREDMLAAMKEFIARNEGTYREPIDPTRRQ